MQKILIIFTLLAINFIQAATVTLNQTVYTPTDGLSIEVEFKEMTGQNKDWIAIYPAGTSNSWKNVIAWKWTGDKTSGKLTLVDVSQRYKIQNGKYEVRAFYNNTYKVETKIAFEIKGANPRKAELKLPKTKYSTSETITVKFSNMIHQNQDWIAIYPTQSNNAWENVIHWAWTDDKISGELTFNTLPKGNYEIRAFSDNSAAVVYARVSFQVKSDEIPKLSVNLVQNDYDPTIVTVNYQNMIKQNKDWIGIYPLYSNNSWSNVIAWKWTGDKNSGTKTFHNLPTGNYEARAFYNNSFKVEAREEFSVNNLFREAREQCLVKGKSTEWVLCSSPTEAYVIDNSKILSSSLHIADFDRGLKLEERIALIDKPNPNSTYVGFRILKDTALIAIDTTYDMGDLVDVTTFYNLEGKVQFSTLIYQNHNDYTRMRGTIKTIENGKKLKITYQGYNHDVDKWMSHEDIYDISNINDIKKISHRTI